MDRRTVLAGLAGVALAASPAASQPALDPENTIVLTTKDGDIVIRLRPDLAPRHVAQIKTLTRRGYYDNVPFHRVIEGFMAQTGDGQRGDGTGRSDLPNIPAEFPPTPFRRGVVGAARAQDPNSANSQFFIMFADGPFLNNQYTVFGEVARGLDVLDKVKRGDPRANGSVQNPDRIVRMRVQADIR